MSELKFKVGDRVQANSPGDGVFVGTVDWVDPDTRTYRVIDANYRTHWCSQSELTYVPDLEKTVTADQVREGMTEEGFSHHAVDRVLVALGLIEQPKEKYVRVVLEIPVDTARFNSDIQSLLDQEWDDDWYVSQEHFEK